MPDMDAICRECFELFGDNSDSAALSQLGLSCHLVGLHPYPAHLIRIFGTNQPARAYSQSLILILRKVLS